MNIPEQLKASIQIFRDLGWDTASKDQIMSLPLGTPEQQKVAKAGLLKGRWGGFGEVGTNTYGWQSWVEVNEDMLGAFAVRLGVPVARAIAVMPARHSYPAMLRGELLASRGPKFVTAFGNAGGQAQWQSTGLVIAVALSEAETPTSAWYLETWANAASAAFSRGNAVSREDPVPEEIIVKRYPDHIRAVLHSGNPAPDAPVALLMGGLERGLITLEEARELVLFAMEQAQRPGDRTTWAALLMDHLEVDPAWLLERSPVLVSTLSFGDNAIISRFVPVLLSSGDDDLILQALLIGLLAKSNKGKAEVLDAAAAIRKPGPDVVNSISESVNELLQSKDRKVKKSAQMLIAAWEMEPEAEPEAVPIPVRGLWQQTPPLAKVPRFDAGPVTSERLTELAARLVTSDVESLSLDGERFLAVANQLARTDSELARTALRGLKNQSTPLLSTAYAWVAGKESVWLDRDDPHWGRRENTIQTARDASVFKRLGSVSVLLSTPSWEDFRIHPEDLADRLYDLKSRSEPALEADLQLALPRLDLELLSEHTRGRLISSPVAVVLQDGSVVPHPAGAFLKIWLENPPVHPGYQDEYSSYPKSFSTFPNLAGLPQRLMGGYQETALPVFPNWPDAALPHRQANVAVLRSRPNGPVTSAGLLDLTGEDAAGIEDALTAWRNGVLLPGAAEATRLGWSGTIQSLAARAVGWAELAEEGLLSVIWPLVTDTIAVSSRGARVSPGVAELVELLARYLPEVQAAVETGLANPSALDLTAVRQLAQRGGSSRAVAEARALVALLPVQEASTEAVTPAGKAPQLSESGFQQGWPEVADLPVLTDGGEVTVELKDGDRGSYLQPTITLHDGRAFRVHNLDWMYPVVQERQIPLDGRASSPEWLGYNAASGTLKVYEGRQSEERVEQDLALSHSLTVILLLSQTIPGDPSFYYLHDAVKKGILGPARVSAAVETLLSFEGADPYRLVRKLARAAESLPALYPILTRSIEHAAGLSGTPPRWLVRIIDVATEFAPVLREASARGLLQEHDAGWPGLADIARSSKSPAAKKKAASLMGLLGLA